MSYNNKSIVPGILIKVEEGLGYFVDEHYYPEDHFYVLTEIETEVGREDILVFYGLIEERFFHRNRFLIERYIEDGIADIVA